MEQIHNGEIWTKSQCLNQEDHINSIIFDKLKKIGFAVTNYPRVWQRNNQTVIVCLVDDLISCGNDYHIDLPYLFDKNTVVITDNRLVCPTLYRTIYLPDSFFGIYSYTPANTHWSPDRDFSFLINRIDTRRFKLMLELSYRVLLKTGYVNFNCDTVEKADRSAAFETRWSELSTDLVEKYTGVYNRYKSRMPYKNYTIDFEQVAYKSFINIIVESYSSDNNIALSEKIFRALVTPAPWTVYSGRYTVAYLESLGFDCLSDLVNHNHYDRLKEVENKSENFIWRSREGGKNIQNMDIDLVRSRCILAATHNQVLLQNFKKLWDKDFSHWLENLPNQLGI